MDKKKPFNKQGDNGNPFNFEPRPTDFLDFQGTLVPTRFINKVEQEDGYDDVNFRPVYKIVINPDPTEKQFLNNAVAKFYTPEAREEFMVKMKEQLYGCNVQFTDVFPSA